MPWVEVPIRMLRIWYLIVRSNPVFSALVEDRPKTPMGIARSVLSLQVPVPTLMMTDRRPYGLVLPPIDETHLRPSVSGETDRWKKLARSMAANVLAMRAATSAPTMVVL